MSGRPSMPGHPPRTVAAAARGVVAQGRIDRVLSATTIIDQDDERIGDYRALTDVELRTRWEPPNGLFIAEGELVLRRALRAGYRLRSVLIDSKRVSQLDDLPLDDVPVYAGDQATLEAITGFHVHRGVLASFHRKPDLAAADILASARRVAILEDVNNHTNLGALFRSAAALGMDAVLLSPSCADPLYRRSVRVSMGEVFAVPYARLEPWPGALTEVRQAGFTVLALTPAADAVAIHHLTQAQRARPALLLGAEGPGLTAAALNASDARVVIPMRRGVDSLNVANAAAVAFWELTRSDDE
ncbi:TrmH family RNA methyltransferase [Dactylosporangium sp. NPDC000521]|uniref:TrmH family RNA methyltransferase n=1 Tax=Dactylosporangium sp. NPDC000521 TaxID=3363975 RepID=UPI0036D18C6C